MCYPRCLQLTQRQQLCGNKAKLRAPTHVCARPRARVLLAGRQPALCQNHMPNDWTSTRIEWRGKVTASFRMPLRSQAQTRCVKQCIRSTRIASAARRRARPVAATTQPCGLAQTARISSREHIMSHYATDVRRGRVHGQNHMPSLGDGLQHFGEEPHTFHRRVRVGPTALAPQRADVVCVQVPTQRQEICTRQHFRAHL